MKTICLLIALLALTGCEALTGSGFDHTVSGPYNMTIVESSTATNGFTCTLTETLSGTLQISYTESGAGLQGEYRTDNHKRTFVSATQGCTDSSADGHWEGAINGTSSNITFSNTQPESPFEWKMEFAGSLSGGVITGTLKMSMSGGTTGANGFTKIGSTSTLVTLK